MPLLVFLGLSVLDLGPMYVTDRQTSDAHHRLMPPPYGGGDITTIIIHNKQLINTVENPWMGPTALTCS